MSEVFYCPQCADYDSNREHRMTDEGYPDTPLCKFCGSECDDLANESRMETLADMVKEMGEARETYTDLINRVQELTNEIRKDYKIEGELICE